MAELPKYQQTGRIFADVPQLDFANVRESFKAAQSMSAGLDRLSQFAFKDAAEIAQQAAMRAAIDQPITLEQLKEAEKSGITAEDLVKATGGGRIWQETMRKFQAEQLRNQLEVAANTEALAIKQMVDTNQLVDPAEIKAKFEALQTGMVKPLIGLDPESALKFQHSTGGLIKNLEKAAYDKLGDNYKLGKQVEAGDYKVVALESIDTIFETEVDPEIIKAKVSLIRKTFAGLANEGGNEFALSEVRSLDKEIEQRQISSFAKEGLKSEFAADRFEAMTRIRNGDFGEKTAIYNSLPADTQAKIRVAVSESWTSLESSKLQKTKEEKDAADKSFRIKVLGNKKKLNLYDEAFLDGTLSLSEWKASKEEGGEGDPVMMSNIQNNIMDNRITSVDQLPAGLTPKAKAKFNLMIRDQDEKNAKKIIRQGANISEGSAFHTESQSAKYAKIEVVYDRLKSETNENGTFKYASKADAALAAIKEHSNSTDVTTALQGQRRALKEATKEISAEDFDYDIPRSEKLLKEYAAKNVAFSQRDKWVKSVLRYQQNKKQTQKSVYDLNNE